MDDSILTLLEDHLEREKWIARAQCRVEQVPVTAFFPTRGASQKEAKDVCSRCPVGAECDDYANRTRTQYGIWNGRIRKRGPDEPDEWEPEE